MTFPLNTPLSLTNHEYHFAPGLGSGMLRDFIESPMLYAAKHVYKNIPPESSTALSLGSVIDSIILDPTELDKLVELIPHEVLNKDGHRKGAAWTEWASTRSDKLLVNHDEWDDIRRMVDCVWACPPAIEMIGRTQHQQTIFWQDGTVGHEILAKCKIDGMDRCGLFDLKTTADPLHQFHNSVRKYKYLTQLAWYSYGWQAAYEEWPSLLSWIVVSKTKPYECMVMDAPSGLKEWADVKITEVLERFGRHQESADWHNPKYQQPTQLNIDLSTYGGY